jgi:ABC-2 type transport system permease protein
MIPLAYSLSILLMVLVPVGLAVLLRRRFRVALVLFVVGSLTFIGSQVVHIPLNNWLSDIGLLPEAGSWEGPPLWRTALIVGLTAGLCEELARAAGYALLRRSRRFEDGVMLGLGHGGIESMVFGGTLTAATISSLLSLRGVDLSSLELSTAQMTAVSRQLELFTSSPWLALPPLLERLLAMGLHVVFSLLVLQAFRRRNGWFLFLAVGYHTTVDVAAVYALQYVENAWLINAGLLGMALPGYVWLWTSRPRSVEGKEHRPPAFSAELGIFLAATSKELLQQVRTRRLLVVVAVFAIMGLMSPALARFTPELLGTIEEAKQFADLIPDPVAADAMTQYIKNITQFGFVLAVLLGMGAVAGEKERGTAAMIMSKPMSRWAFVTSKFAAQAAVYCLSFGVAAAGGYLYTLLLFGPIDLGNFLLINLLLLAWLLPFVAVALLGSTLASTTGAAAGVGFGGSVVLLLAGSLPGVGALAPGGLIAWATQLSTGTSGDQVMANGGALVMSCVIVLMCLIAAVGVFEEQEL